MKKIIYMLLFQFIYIKHSQAQLFEMTYAYSLNLYKGEYNNSYQLKGGQHSVGGLYTTPKNAFGASIGFGTISGKNKDNAMMPIAATFTNKYQEFAIYNEFHFFDFHPAMNGSGFTPVILLSAGAQKINAADNWVTADPDIQKSGSSYNFWFGAGAGFKMVFGRFIFRSNYTYYINSNSYLDGVSINKKPDGLSRVNIGLGYMFNAGSDCTQKRLAGNYFQWGDKF